MPPIDFVHELLLPEGAVIIIALVALGVCLYSWFKCKEYAALGYIWPALYFVVTYTLFFIYPSITDDWRRVIVRGGLLVLFSNIVFQRIKYIMICRSKEREQRT